MIAANKQHYFYNRPLATNTPGMETVAELIKKLQALPKDMYVLREGWSNYETVYHDTTVQVERPGWRNEPDDPDSKEGKNGNQIYTLICWSQQEICVIK